MSGPSATALGSVRLLGDNATLIGGMTNAERCRRLAESAAKGGSALAPGHELLFNLAFVFDPMLLREVLDRPGTLFAWNGVPVVGQIEKGGDPMAGAATDLSDGRKLYRSEERRVGHGWVSTGRSRGAPDS